MSTTSPAVVAALGVLIGGTLGVDPTPLAPSTASHASSSVAISAPATAGAATATAGATMKPYGAGNATRGFATLNGFPSASGAGVTTIVIDTAWNALESSEGVYTSAPIDAELASAAAKGLTVRLRIIAGTQAPAYVKKLGGSPIPFYDHQMGGATTIGRFWRTDYQARWQALMRYLAGKYDGNRLIRDVNISGTGTISAEVMLTMGSDTIPGSSVTNNDRLLAAGATETARRAALMNDIAFMQRTWPRTHTTLFCHPYVPLSPSARADLTATEQIVTTAYTNDPGATVFGNTGASEATLRGVSHANVLEMYQYFIAHRYPFMAQTQTLGGGAKNEGVGDLSYVVAWLAAHGAYATELPKGWETDDPTLRVLPGTTRRMVASATGGSLG